MSLPSSSASNIATKSSEAIARECEQLTLFSGAVGPEIPELPATSQSRTSNTATVPVPPPPSRTPRPAASTPLVRYRSVHPRGYVSVGSFFTGFANASVWVRVDQSSITVSLDPFEEATRSRLGTGKHPRLYLTGDLADAARSHKWRADRAVEVAISWADDTQRVIIIKRAEVT